MIVKNYSFFACMRTILYFFDSSADLFLRLELSRHLSLIWGRTMVTASIIVFLRKGFLFLQVSVCPLIIISGIYISLRWI